MPNLSDETLWDASEVCESLPDGFFALDSAWNFVYVNAQAARLLRRPPQELLGHSLWQEFPQAENTQFQWQYQKAVAERRPVDFEAFFGPHDAWYAVHAHPSPQGLAVYFRDISDTYATLARLRETVAQLERAQAQTELTLAQVKGGGHLLGLINEVLTVSRIESGELSLALEPVSVPELVRETIALLRPLAQSYGVEIVDDVDGHHERHVLADAQRLREALLNLGSNAIKYNRAAGQVRFFTELRERTGRLRIGVRDTGYGLSVEDLAKLFVPFERLGAAKMGIEGAGIGLTLSQRLVEAMAGTLDVQSAPGRGSTFSIVMPLTEDPPRDSRNFAHDEEERNSGPLSANSGAPVKKLLCIEDNLDNLPLVETLLEKRHDIRVLAAMQGSTGMDLAREHHPNLILLDLHLPDIGGHEMLRRLRADPGTQEIPVIVVSADTAPHQVQRLLAAGARECIAKPIEVRRFLKIVDEVLYAAPLPAS